MNAPDPAPRPRALFRQEAIDAQREKLLGELITIRPVRMWVFTLLAGAFAAGLGVFAFVGEYTRRERVEGFLAGDAGAAHILAPVSGVVSRILVKEGDVVQRDQEIARLKLENNQPGGSTSAQVEQQLQLRKRGLESEQSEALLIGQHQREQQQRRIEALQREMAQSRDEIALQEQRVAWAQQEVQRYEDLAKKGFVPDSMVREKKNELLDQQAKLESLKRALSGIDRDQRTAQAELPLIELRARTRVQEIEGKKGELEQDLLQNKAKQEVAITATIDGTVTNIVPSLGDSVAAESVVATILPSGTLLHAQLLVPTRAIGFITVGSPVVLRYDAFQFQRFGQYRGTVTSVGGTVWSSGERIGPLTTHEPVYRVDVKLDRQTVSAGAQEFHLRPGMMVSADILLEKRTVFEWIFEPVLSLRERLR